MIKLIAIFALVANRFAVALKSKGLPVTATPAAISAQEKKLDSPIKSEKKSEVKAVSVEKNEVKAEVKEKKAETNIVQPVTEKEVTKPNKEKEPASFNKLENKEKSDKGTLTQTQAVKDVLAKNKLGDEKVSPVKEKEKEKEKELPLRVGNEIKEKNELKVQNADQTTRNSVQNNNLGYHGTEERKSDPNSNYYLTAMASSNQRLALTLPSTPCLSCGIITPVISPVTTVFSPATRIISSIPTVSRVLVTQMDPIPISTVSIQRNLRLSPLSAIPVPVTRTFITNSNPVRLNSVSTGITSMNLNSIASAQGRLASTPVIAQRVVTVPQRVYVS